MPQVVPRGFGDLQRIVTRGFGLRTPPTKGGSAPHVKVPVEKVLQFKLKADILFTFEKELGIFSNLSRDWTEDYGINGAVSFDTFKSFALASQTLCNKSLQFKMVSKMNYKKLAQYLRAI